MCVWVRGVSVYDVDVGVICMLVWLECAYGVYVDVDVRVCGVYVRVSEVCMSVGLV